MSVPSPCQKVCRLDGSSELCVACFRTLDEIGRWRDMSDDERRAVLRSAERRAAGAADQAPVA